MTNEITSLDHPAFCNPRPTETPLEGLISTSHQEKAQTFRATRLDRQCIVFGHGKIPTDQPSHEQRLVYDPRVEVY